MLLTGSLISSVVPLLVPVHFRSLPHSAIPPRDHPVGRRVPIPVESIAVAMTTVMEIQQEQELPSGMREGRKGSVRGLYAFSAGG